MLSDEQVHLVPGCHERQRSSAPADGGMGIQGLLSLQFDSEFGVIDSVSRTRIITDDDQTLIAQLTLTALHDSPVDWASIRISVEPEPVALDATAIPGPGSCVTFIAPGVDR